MANIYVIDDDDQLLRMVGLMLERGGHSPTLIGSPEKGLEKIRADKPDLLVLDVMMPGMSGHDVCRQIRADESVADLPILILTARAQEVDRVTALKSGADDYLSKPITAQELMERVSDLLTHRRSDRGTSRPGTIITLLGLRGGVGRTTLAVNLAAALRRISQQDVCLIDLSPSGGQAVMHLRLQASKSWADLSAADALDWENLQKHLITHQSGLSVLAAPSLPQRPSVPPAGLTARMLHLLKENASAIVVDLPSMFNPAVGAALSASDVILHVLTPEVVSVQMAVRTNRALAAAGIKLKHRSHILNQISAEAQLPQAAVERGLGARLAFQVGHDVNQSRALAQGVPLALTSIQSPLPVVVRRMAEAIRQRVKQS